MTGFMVPERVFVDDADGRMSPFVAAMQEQQGYSEDKDDEPCGRATRDSSDRCRMWRCIWRYSGGLLSGSRTDKVSNSQHTEEITYLGGTCTSGIGRWL